MVRNRFNLNNLFSFSSKNNSHQNKISDLLLILLIIYLISYKLILYLHYRSIYLYKVFESVLLIGDWGLGSVD
ncbi:MAG: hypothetical protein MJ252_16435 [archaeon]|nr:hypothetical protein [archaeon]